jgi:XTP/dITP diphosphohydrolase
MPLPARIVMASGNAGKLREIRRLLEGLAVDVLPQSDFNIPEADETGLTFAENSLIKARHAARLTGLPAIADDSGLCVDALDGRPGVYSARYAGVGASDAANIDKLLDELGGRTDRSAAFHCVATFVSDADAEPIVAEGTWRGEILAERRGSGGFGYDPVFLDPASGLAAAELGAEQKNARSHRGAALRSLVERLLQLDPR